MNALPGRAGALVLCGMFASATLAMPSALMAAERYEGLARTLRGGDLVYREIHWVFEDGGVPARLVLYRCPDGGAFARKRVAYRDGATTPDFAFVDGRDGYREGVRTVDGRREVYWQSGNDARPRQRGIALGPGTIVDEGFNAAVRAHWDALVAGRSVDARFLLPSSLDFIKVRLYAPDGDGDPESTQLAMRLDAWYGFALPETRLLYRNRDRRLLRFEGIGTIRDRHGERQAVRIDFPEALRVDGVERAQIDAALAAPLTGRCGD